MSDLKLPIGEELVKALIIGGSCDAARRHLRQPGPLPSPGACPFCDLARQWIVAVNEPWCDPHDIPDHCSYPHDHLQYPGNCIPKGGPRCED